VLSPHAMRPDFLLDQRTLWRLIMNIPQTKMRELTGSELEQVMGGSCVQGAHIKDAIVTTTTSSGSWWGTDEAGGQKS
jgi:hypothetical protein